jgi:hypothetical protein
MVNFPIRLRSSSLSLLPTPSFITSLLELDGVRSKRTELAREIFRYHSQLRTILDQHEMVQEDAQETTEDLVGGICNQPSSTYDHARSHAQCWTQKRMNAPVKVVGNTSHELVLELQISFCFSLPGPERLGCAVRDSDLADNGPGEIQQDIPARDCRASRVFCLSQTPIPTQKIMTTTLEPNATPLVTPPECGLDPSAPMQH